MEDKYTKLNDLIYKMNAITKEQRKTLSSIEIKREEMNRKMRKEELEAQRKKLEQSSFNANPQQQNNYYPNNNPYPNNNLNNNSRNQSFNFNNKGFNHQGFGNQNPNMNNQPNLNNQPPMFNQPHMSNVQPNMYNQPHMNNNPQQSELLNKLVSTINDLKQELNSFKEKDQTISNANSQNSENDSMNNLLLNKLEHFNVNMNKLSNQNQETLSLKKDLDFDNIINKLDLKIQSKEDELSNISGRNKKN